MVVTGQSSSMDVAANRGTGTVAEKLFQHRVYMRGVLASCVQAADAAIFAGRCRRCSSAL